MSIMSEKESKTKRESREGSEIDNKENAKENKFESNKLSQSSEIIINLAKEQSPFITQQPETISSVKINAVSTLTLLEEINADMDSLHKELSTNSPSINAVSDALFCRKATQIEEDIIPISKVNKSVQISDKDYFSTKAFHNVKSFSPQTSQYGSKALEEISFASFRTKKMEDISKSKQKPIVYNQRDNYNPRELHYSDLQNSEDLRHRDCDKSTLIHSNHRYNEETFNQSHPQVKVRKERKAPFKPRNSKPKAYFN